MDEDISQALSQACDDCHLAGGCCFEARPPLSQKRIDILMENGVSPDAVEIVGYKRLCLGRDGFCVLFRDGKCSIHEFKPETCVAGPFTFDIDGDMLRIFLKRESICPMVRFLRANRKAYDALFEISVEKIMDLIRNVPDEEMAQILKIEEPETDLVAEIQLEE